MGTPRKEKPGSFFIRGFFADCKSAAVENYFENFVLLIQKKSFCAKNR